MSFSTFLEILPQIAIEIHPNLSLTNAIQQLLEEKLLPLHEKVMAKKKYVEKEKDVGDIQFDELVCILLRNVGDVLLEIYKIYFQHEIRGNEKEDAIQKINEKTIFELLRDYDICPTLISKGVAF